MKKFLSVVFSAMFLLTACGGSSDSDPINEVPDSNITSVQGNLTTDTVLVINGSGFTVKANAKPLFWWKADFGENPSSLGRKTAWDDTSGVGNFSTAVVAPGSQQALAKDHGTAGAALPLVEFDSDQLYLHRKTYEDFDIAENVAIRTRYIGLSGTINVGDVVTGLTSGATGVVNNAFTSSSSSPINGSIYYSKQGGTINDDPKVDFIKGETMTIAATTMTNSEGAGTLRTFNFKTLRFWADRFEGGFRNNIHVNTQGAESNTAFRITPEGTEGTTWSSQFTNQRLYPLSKEWKVEEAQYQASQINVKDGIFNFYQKGILGTDNKFITRDTDAPNKYHRVYQSQVSNGAQLGSIMYYDSLYMDDTWHRVLLCAESTWSARSNCEVQIPTSWNDSKVTVHINKGGLDTSKASYLYVINKNGEPNENGWLLER